ncbi:hypothetical protein MKY14_04800 [Paenibacillus sp. FSL R5-0887]|uniref:hypothetical protein n=1 Tax=unclassified Paenibacillus TaxID=185978 RepID=UPI00247352E6|nr:MULTISPECIES: hypothetical protein [unclassified Paenibacillus]MDH6427138.1 hypothetical protein [Paenibacillus sp. PastH-4]MDH6443167.1 hypothetical protein [Paenibacillus sp. PastF-4]MDH6526128.1 hypothetical protein [Paenibacillus sp. PastH-3]
MRKSPLILSMILLSLALIMGCSSEVDDATKAAEKYKNIEYTVKASEDLMSDESILARNEEMKPYFTEYFSEKAIANRITTIPFKIADTQKLSLKPENLKFNLSEQKKDIVELKYTVDLVLLDKDDKESKRVPLEGILTLFDVDGKWLVQGDRFDTVALMNLIDG